jgi:hypothetical protein
LQGAGGDLDQGIFGNESQRSRHAYLSVSASAKLRVPKIESLENSGTVRARSAARSAGTVRESEVVAARPIAA